MSISKKNKPFETVVFDEIFLSKIGFVNAIADLDDPEKVIAYYSEEEPDHMMSKCKPAIVTETGVFFIKLGDMIMIRGSKLIGVINE